MNRRSYKGSNNPNYGKHHSKESKDKISEKKKGVKLRTYNPKHLQLFNKEITNSIINGIMLSDGHITNDSKGHSLMVLEQSIKNHEFITAFEMELIKLNQSYGKIVRTRQRIKNGKSLTSVIIHSNANWFFSLLRKRWYVNNKKVVPKSLELTPKTLAYWFMGDGNSYRNKKTGYITTSFATHSFIESELLILKSKIESFGIDVMIDKKNNVIRINKQKSVYKLMELIYPFMLESFLYKIKIPSNPNLFGTPINSVIRWQKILKKYPKTIKLAQNTKE